MILFKFMANFILQKINKKKYYLHLRWEKEEEEDLWVELQEGHVPGVITPSTYTDTITYIF
jgi:hypothetical protein